MTIFALVPPFISNVFVVFVVAVVLSVLLLSLSYYTSAATSVISERWVRNQYLGVECLVLPTKKKVLIKRWSKIWLINSFEEVLWNSLRCNSLYINRIYVKTKSLRILDGGLIFMVFSICWNPQGTVTVFNVVFILRRSAIANVNSIGGAAGIG